MEYTYDETFSAEFRLFICSDLEAEAEAGSGSSQQPQFQIKIFLTSKHFLLIKVMSTLVV